MKLNPPPASLATAAVLASLSGASGQVCQPYYADMGPSAYAFTYDWFAVYDDGGGPAIYRPGYLTSQDLILRYRNGSWQPFSLAGLPPGFIPTSPRVFDLGSGPSLFLTGAAPPGFEWL